MLMYLWENLKELYIHIKVYVPYIPPFVNIYCRFIDNLSFLWNRSERKVLGFIAKLNTCHLIIKFDYKDSQSSVDLLDRKVCKNKGQNKLLPIAYCKPRDSKNSLNHKSAHPKLLIESMPYGQAL